MREMVQMKAGFKKIHGVYFFSFFFIVCNFFNYHVDSVPSFPKLRTL